ncbi:MAG: GIY-YIG nuclease family protein [Blastomonas sp.]|uniref:TrmH family RNA methyltransferase n=2 Tax=Sphingomonadaceae TaxID=41297 RepID=UPI00258F13F0|nr:TrmH family RNA methyltransferase [Blastomonas sp.]MCO5792385.1 GIY-YIG nuclease family protein [Blastomonas sp.]
MPYFTYMLRCGDGSYFVGHGENLDADVAAHQAGAVPGYTKARQPVELVWSEDFATADNAQAVDRQIKGWSRAKKEALIRQDYGALSERARKMLLGKAKAARNLQSAKDAAPGDLRKPIVILVRPQLGENIGKAARAMLNFGLTEMRLVAPRDGWPNPSAGPAASGADIVLEQAQVFETVADAVADCNHVYATTVRKRGVTKPVVTPAVAASQIVSAPGRSAILFGPERSGLETEDVAIAHAILTVPINPQFGSLNLAQAVILVAYEWSKTGGGDAVSSPTEVELDPPAPMEELDGMFEQLCAMLEAKNYFFPEGRASMTRRTLRNLLTKPQWNSNEVRTFRGVLSTLAKDKRKPVD